MSARSFRRAHARRLARERRRAGLLGRKGVRVAGLALTTGTLFVANASANVYTVTTTGDDSPTAACIAGGTSGTYNCDTLRDAVTAANSSGLADTIDFGAGLTGTIRLTNGALSVSDSGGVTITGGGADLTISGDANDDGKADSGDSQVFTLNAGTKNTIEDLTVTDGYATGSLDGGAISSANIPLDLAGDTITDSIAAGTGSGGGVYTDGNLTVTDSTITGNTAPTSNGGGISAGGHQTSITASTISKNSSSTSGGGLFLANKYTTSVTDSTISGNTSPAGGGIEIGKWPGKYDPTPAAQHITITGSTISGNNATRGAGIELSHPLRHSNEAEIEASTISGNVGGASSDGGGLLIDDSLYGKLKLIDSTVSGNIATTGGGLAVGVSTAPLELTYAGTTGSIALENSTIAGNSATSADGGGVYLAAYSTGTPATVQSPTVTLGSTIVSGNTAAGAAQDLFRPATSTTGGFDTAFSLIQNPGNAPMLSEQSDILGKNPLLGPLAANGVSTETMLPAGTSPVIDQGHAPNSLTTDERDGQRTVDVPGIPKPPGGDGTDIGAVELPASSVPAVLTATLRGNLLSSAVSPLLPGSSSPIDCTVRIGTLKSCVIHIVSGGKLIADGDAQSSTGDPTLPVGVTPTAAGLKSLAHRPLGITAPATIAGSGDGGTETITGNVHLLAGPLFTLPTGKTDATKTLSKSVQSELKQAAQLLTGAGAKSASCTAYTKKGPHKGKNDKSATKAKAKLACSDLAKDGFKGKTSSSGKGHAIAANQLVISFKF